MVWGAKEGHFPALQTPRIVADHEKWRQISFRDMASFSKWFTFGRDQLYDQGLRAFDAGLFEESASLMRQSRDRAADPTHRRLCEYYLAESLMAMGRTALKAYLYETARDAFEEAISIEPRYADLHFLHAMACAALGHHGLEESSLRRALEINPNYARAYLHLGIAAYRDARFAEGLKDIACAVQMDPDMAGERYEFALYCHSQGDTARALANFRALDNSDALDANSHARMGDNFARKGLWFEAGQEYESALMIAPNYADVRCKYGLTLLELGNSEGALAQFNRAIEINPHYADAHAHRGIALRRLNRLDEAREAFRLALDHDRHHPIAQHEIGRRA